MNTKLLLDTTNGKLRTRKRKLEEHVIDFEGLKKRKTESGKAPNILTYRSTLKEPENRGLPSGFTDLNLKQPIYSIKYSYSKSPRWMTNTKEENINTDVCRSWDNDWNCYHCDPSHNIFSNKKFALIIGDQNCPSYIPAIDGECIAVIRLHNLTLCQQIDLSLRQVVKGRDKRCVVRDSDEFGAAEALNRAINKNCDIYLFYTSGSGLITEQAAGTTYQIQRAIELANDRDLGGVSNTPFKMVTFLAPALPHLPLPDSNSSHADRSLKLDIEQAGAARAISLNSSLVDYKLKSFVSNTESVMMENYKLALEPHYSYMRENISFQAVSVLVNNSKGTDRAEMKKCMLGPTPTWPTKERSRGKALSLQFLAEYSAAVHADYMYAIKLGKVSNHNERKELPTPKQEIDVMTKKRADEPNIVMPVHLWNNESNELNKDCTRCLNFLKHKALYFTNETEWKKHVIACYAGEQCPNIKSNTRK